MVIIFKNRESEYHDWLRANPIGYVLTTSTSMSPLYMSLHLSRCHKISVYTRNMAKDAFTGRQYIKVCSNSAVDLLSWVKSNGGQDFTVRCSFCSPLPTVEGSDEIDVYRSALAADVSASQRDSVDARRHRLANASGLPRSVATTATIYLRNADVIAEVLARAAGICERCNRPAPFERATDRSPYLEVHHMIQLSKGGADTVENAVAICPNCHRQAHFGYAGRTDRTPEG